MSKNAPCVNIRLYSLRNDAVAVVFNAAARELIGSKWICCDFQNMSIRVAGIDDRRVQTLSYRPSSAGFTYTKRGEDLTRLLGKYDLVQEEEAFYLEKINP